MRLVLDFPVHLRSTLTTMAFKNENPFSLFSDVSIRSTALEPLYKIVRFVGILMIVTATGNLFGLESPVQIIPKFFWVFIGLLGLYVLLYLYLFWRDRNALRSDSFRLGEMAIKEGYGDSSQPHRSSTTSPEEKEDG